MPVAKIIKPGLLTTVQDLGRTGFRHLGVPVSGAMDQWALRTANTLVGNPQGAAVLETTLSGPVIQFLRDCIIAITGADMSPRISGQEVPLGETIYCSAGSLLELGYRKNGCRCYLAFAGGIEEPPVLESRSTFLTGGFGGLEGRRMRNGDLIKTAPCDINKVKMGRSLGNLFSCNNTEITVKVISGINRDKFNSVEYNKLFSTTFVVSRTINRMGCHLDSNTCINSTNSAVSESYPAVPGSIQILPSGLPVILLNDAQSTGGYPQIAAIIAADLWKIGQAVPGDRICFTETDYSTAAGLYQQQCDQTKAIEYKSNRSFGHKTPHYYYKVTIQYKS